MALANETPSRGLHEAAARIRAAGPAIQSGHPRSRPAQRQHEAQPAMTQTSRHPLTWVPSLYLAMGLPNVMVGVVAAIIYKNLGVSN